MSDIISGLAQVTDRIVNRSRESRKRYLDLVERSKSNDLARRALSPGNQAHAYAGCALHDKMNLMGASWPNLAIVSAYNDMLSAHAPYVDYPEIIKSAARSVGATAQVAGGVPAMCDGVTQGTSGMELSLFSRDVIAMSTAIALSHNCYDAGLYLGICDKIVPGLLIGALQFGHLPAVFVPAGPMPSGLPNKEKIRIRQLFAQGKIDRERLLKAEMESYHGQGTCTFYGTANSNQMLMEIMGLHIPGAAFVNPGTDLRLALTQKATEQAVFISTIKPDYTPLADIISERCIVNAIVGLMATGGSTNHTLHIPAIAKAAGIQVSWDDFNDISRLTPLITKIYPNGSADINHFHAAGGTSLLIRELLSAGLLHENVTTIMGEGLSRYVQEPALDSGRCILKEGVQKSLDVNVISSFEQPFEKEGGLVALDGNLGRAIIKTSAVDKQMYKLTAPVAIYESQNDMLIDYKKGALNRDVIVVVRYQGPRANGMPELHMLMPALGSLIDQGFKVALLTDGRLSGASGKVPAAIHITPEAAQDGPLAKLKEGDIVTLDVKSRKLCVDAPDFESREAHQFRCHDDQLGLGRDIFESFRKYSADVEDGAGLGVSF